MTLEQAITAAQAYEAQRKEVRKLLINELRNRLDGYKPASVNKPGPGAFTSAEVRKLNSFPSDLSDARLLAMLERTTK